MRPISLRVCRLISMSTCSFNWYPSAILTLRSLIIDFLRICCSFSTRSANCKLSLFRKFGWPVDANSAYHSLSLRVIFRLLIWVIKSNGIATICSLTTPHPKPVKPPIVWCTSENESRFAKSTSKLFAGAALK